MQQGFVEECTLLFENNLLEISKLYCIQFLATCHTNVLHCLCIHNLCVIKRYNYVTSITSVEKQH